MVDRREKKKRSQYTLSLSTEDKMFLLMKAL